MECVANGGLISGVAPFVILLSLVSPTASQDPKPKNNVLENLALCNGTDRTSPELQINGCTAIIDLGEQTPAATIAYDIRDDAYPGKGAMTSAMRPSLKVVGQREANSSTTLLP